MSFSRWIVPLVLVTLLGDSSALAGRRLPVRASSAAKVGANPQDRFPVLAATSVTAGSPMPGGPSIRPASRAYRWPLAGRPAVVRRFDPPPQPWLAGHRGVDLAGMPGAAVSAAGAGIVVFAGRIAGRGVVSVAHAGGLRTTYEPVEVRPAIRAGDRVAAGDPLGVLAAGHPGCPEPACLHWGLRRGSQYLDPLLLVGLGRVRLLPLDGLGGRPGSLISAGSAVQRRAASRPGSRSASRSYSSGRL